MTKEQLKNLCGNLLFQNNCMNTLCEMILELLEIRFSRVDSQLSRHKLTGFFADFDGSCMTDLAKNLQGETPSGPCLDFDGSCIIDFDGSCMLDFDAGCVQDFGERCLVTSMCVRVGGGDRIHPGNARKSG